VKATRLSQIDCYELQLPVAGGSYTMSQGRRLTSFTTVVVRVIAEDGTAGFGESCTLGTNYIEAFPAGVEATIRELAPVVLEQPVLEPDLAVRAMDAAVLGHLAGKAALDVALWDLRGKLLGQPVAVLLGGVLQPSYPAFHALTLDAPERMAEEAMRMREQGYRCWQLKLGSEPAMDAERLRSVLAAVGDSADFVTSDPNAAWTVAQACEFLLRIGGLKTFVEQTCPTLAEMREVRKRSPWPVTVDESVRTVPDLLDCLRLEAADALNIKITRVGGITRAARLRDAAQAAGLMLMVDEPMGSHLATAAIAQVAAGCRPESFLAASHIGAYSALPLVTDPPELRAGKTVAPTGPGLGVEVDESALGEPLFSVSR
jgi:L-alanine-DL-glutamate epimerase-like enolase superfamily enzyme